MCKCCQSCLETIYWHLIEKRFCYDESIALYEEPAPREKEKNNNMFDNMAFYDSVAVIAGRAIVTIDPLPNKRSSDKRPLDKQPIMRQPTRSKVTWESAEDIENRTNEEKTQQMANKKILGDVMNKHMISVGDKPIISIDDSMLDKSVLDKSRISSNKLEENIDVRNKENVDKSLEESQLTQVTSEESLLKHLESPGQTNMGHLSPERVPLKSEARALEPKTHQFNIPVLNTPGLNTPGLNTPGLNTPGLNTPEFNTPEFNTQFNKHSLHKHESNKMSKPELNKSETDQSELNRLSKSEHELTKLELSKLEASKSDHKSLFAKKGDSKDDRLLKVEEPVKIRKKSLKERRQSKCASLNFDQKLELPMIKQHSMPRFFVDTPDEYQHDPSIIRSPSVALSSPIKPKHGEFSYDLKSIVEIENERLSLNSLRNVPVHKENSHSMARLVHITNRLSKIKKHASTNSLPNTVNHI